MPTWRASLPMYNLPEMRAENTAFWAALRAELGAEGMTHLPAELSFDRPPVPGAIEAENLFTQVCGYPLQTIFRGQARLLGVPTYAVEHCAPGRHAAVFIVRADAPYQRLADLKGADFVFNSPHSNSGMNLPRLALARIGARAPFFASIRETHSHPANVERVAKGEADATCVDNVTYAFMARHRPWVRETTRILAPTPSTPAIPFVTAITTPEPIVAALKAALLRVGRDARWAEARAGLMMAEILPPEVADYPEQIRHEAEAAALGYPEFR
ncbi:PhnD/SsuA/transferrin family substrate-binding protein [Roseococcus sp. SDR]|uniref:phosphate/phosphite/phosphonate ABC transporter substrate-binding protein n=1 Tax=Roseococcus sp. SDR TaxID=2835532 RepID=UPI001BCE81E5|nr:PhnD/SsuA/transferrin family substrate-binding protein [Roseococcus sp. SDR]MBS7790138.1 PhnD/SsuA/transferrin family substrate-binding protein [Roseococcus sp. SDR]MBV1845452.1 PhnD/SsuA/transferrin family substrate-binding protein [Roseococcus sp. SDR]